MNDVEGLPARVAELVGGVQAVAHVGEDVGDNLRGEAALLVARDLEDPAERLALHVLHGQEKLSLGLAEGERVDHVGVREELGEAGLAEEHLLVARVAGSLGEEALQGHDALETRPAPLERDLDAPHAAFADDEERPVAVRDGAAPRGRQARFEPASGRLLQRHRPLV